LSADDVARDVLAVGEPAYREVVERFGGGVLGPDAQIDRPALARIIFADAEARRDLDSITHPRIIARIDEAIKAFRADHSAADAVLAVEVPLLIECGMEPMVDEVMLVAAEQETQVHRLTSRTKISRDEALRRIGSQMPISRKISHADRVIWNDSDIRSLRESVEAAWSEIRLLLREQL
jgi:dephospho-CoA kinase